VRDEADRTLLDREF